jgi:hypothetical protein
MPQLRGMDQLAVAVWCGGEARSHVPEADRKKFDAALDTARRDPAANAMVLELGERAMLYAAAGDYGSPDKPAYLGPLKEIGPALVVVPHDRPLAIVPHERVRFAELLEAARLTRGSFAAITW